MSITTTFTIATVDFQNGPYQPANIGEVIDIAAGDTSVSEISYPPVPPAPGVIPMDTWTCLASDGTDYTVTSAADGATATAASYSATATALTWSIAGTGAIGATSITLAPAAVIPVGGAPVHLTFTVDLPADAARNSSLTLSFNLVSCTDNPGDHVGGTFPVPGAPNLLANYDFRQISAGPTDTQLAVGGGVFGGGSPLAVTFPVTIQMILTAGGVEVTANATSLYSTTLSTAADIATSALLTLQIDWNSDAGATPYGLVLSDMSWAAP